MSITGVESANDSINEKEFKVFVGNVPFNCTQEEFQNCFSNVPGYKNADVIRRYNSNFSRGFGFITFNSDSDATALLSSHDNIILKDRTLRLSRYSFDEKTKLNTQLDTNSRYRRRDPEERREHRDRRENGGRQRSQGQDGSDDQNNQNNQNNQRNQGQRNQRNQGGNADQNRQRGFAQNTTELIDTIDAVDTNDLSNIPLSDNIDNLNVLTIPTRFFVYVRNLPEDMTSENIRTCFATFGELGVSYVNTDRQTGQSKQTAVVEFKNKDVFDKVLQLKEVTHLNTKLQISPLRQRRRVNLNNFTTKTTNPQTAYLAGFQAGRSAGFQEGLNMTKRRKFNNKEAKV
jgi:RNA recognition motif-containing protein